MFDTLLAGYLLNPSASGYEPLRLAREYGVPVPEGIPEEAASAAVMPALADALERKIAENGQT